VDWLKPSPMLRNVYGDDGGGGGDEAEKGGCDYADESYPQRIDWWEQVHSLQYISNNTRTLSVCMIVSKEYGRHTHFVRSNQDGSHCLVWRLRLCSP